MTNSQTTAIFSEGLLFIFDPPFLDMVVWFEFLESGFLVDGVGVYDVGLSGFFGVGTLYRNVDNPGNQNSAK